MTTPRVSSEEMSSLPPLPPEIRFDPLPCSEDAIALANAVRRRTGERAFEPTEVAIERIQKTLLSSSEETIDSWAFHPDERVPLKLLDAIHLVGPEAVKNGNIAVAKLLRRR